MQSADVKTYMDLKTADVCDLWKEVQSGSAQAVEQIIALNMHLVSYIAAKFTDAFGRRAEYDDILQTAVVGLLSAINTLDMNRLLTFPAYAAKCIVNELNAALRRSGTCWSNTETFDELPETAENMIRIRVDDFYLCCERCDIARALECLTDREREVLLKLFFEERTDTETAVMLGISKQRVGQIKRNAVKKLWGILTNNGEYAYGFTSC